MKYITEVKPRVEKNVITRVKRILRGGKGRFNVKAGQEVGPADIIGNAEISSGFRILNLSSLLSVSPKDAGKYLKREIGQRIYKGELLAFKKEWFFAGKKVITAPTDGVLDSLDNQTGELRISFLPKKADLPAGVFGVVEVVDQERGQVVIRTEVSRVHGMFGSGRSRDGFLHILGKKDDLISRTFLKGGYEGQVLVGGSLIYKDAISVAISAGASGIITGGINASDYRGMSGPLVFPRKLENDIGISIVVCEGFGLVPIGGDIFELLSEYEGKFVFIDGNKALINLPSYSSSSIIRVRSTRLPELQNNELPEETKYTERLAELEIGMKVRIVGSSYLGEQGKLVAIDNTQTLLPSKIKACLVTVETKRRKIQVPVANLQIIL
ncbi:hypothetical protein HYU95_05235 [Candidatus Daviesbacteria bacterium]|nr:hypothetical protein [Candidatus Daviesbacteria bacterium]